MEISSNKSAATSNGDSSRKLKTREKLIVAADELFEELGGYNGGYEATTIDLIVERAGVSRRSFFNHFTGKADVILLDFRVSIEDHLSAFSQRPDSEPPLVSALMSAEDIYQNFLGNPINIRRFERQIKYGNSKSSQLSLMVEWERKLAELMIKKLSGRKKSERARIMASHALLIIRMGSDDWFKNGLKKNQSIIKSIRKTESLMNSLVKEIYPIILD